MSKTQRFTSAAASGAGAINVAPRGPPAAAPRGPRGAQCAASASPSASARRSRPQWCQCRTDPRADRRRTAPPRASPPCRRASYPQSPRLPGRRHGMLAELVGAVAAVDCGPGYDALARLADGQPGLRTRGAMYASSREAPLPNPRGRLPRRAAPRPPDKVRRRRRQKWRAVRDVRRLCRAAGPRIAEQWQSPARPSRYARLPVRPHAGRCSTGTLLASASRRRIASHRAISVMAYPL